MECVSMPDRDHSEVPRWFWNGAHTVDGMASDRSILGLSTEPA